MVSTDEINKEAMFFVVRAYFLFLQSVNDDFIAGSLTTIQVTSGSREGFVSSLIVHLFRLRLFCEFRFSRSDRFRSSICLLTSLF
jgi:hypothetical protein